MVSILKKIMLQISEYMEIILAVYLTVVLVLVIGRTIFVETPAIFTEGASIHYFLEGALTLAIAIEFVKMLCMHTPGTLIEVLLFAIARHMIVEHLTPVQNLLIVLSIAILFAVRKYLLTLHDQKGMNEHASGTHSIVEDLRRLRRDRVTLSSYMEGTREARRLQRAEREIRWREENRKAAEERKAAVSNAASEADPDEELE